MDLIRHKIYWFTGLPCSGKTTLANLLAGEISAEVLDGDDLRTIFKNYDFSLEGRRQHMLSVANLADRFSKYTSVMVALVSPIREVREEIKRKYSNLIEVYVKCDIEVCKSRDVKGMYAKALRGEITNFTGIDSPYEPPILGAERTVIVDANRRSIEDCLEDLKKIVF